MHNALCMSTTPPKHAAWKTIVLWSLLIAAFVGIYASRKETYVSYEQLLDEAGGNVAAVELVRHEHTGMARAKYIDSRGFERITVPVPLLLLVRDLDEKHVIVTAPADALNLAPMVLTTAPLIIVGALFFAMMRQLKKVARPSAEYMIAALEHWTPGAASSPTKPSAPELAPLGLAMAALKAGEVSSHFVLAGPSGSGKTHAVKQLASVHGLHVVVLQSQDLFMTFVGVAAGRLDNAWAQAKARKPCVFLLENVDLFAARHELGDQDKNLSETRSALFKLCALLEAPRDGGPLFIGTTTRLDALDEMLMAPHRMDAVMLLPARPPQ